MEDFPLHTWKFSQLQPKIREHALLTLRQQGFFAHNGSDEDFNMFCKQVEINSQSIAREKEERHNKWALEHPEAYRLQTANQRGRGRSTRGIGGRGYPTFTQRNNQNQQRPNYYAPHAPNHGIQGTSGLVQPHVQIGPNASLPANGNGTASTTESPNKGIPVVNASPN